MYFFASLRIRLSFILLIPLMLSGVGLLLFFSLLCCISVVTHVVSLFPQSFISMGHVPYVLMNSSIVFRYAFARPSTILPPSVMNGTLIILQLTEEAAPVQHSRGHKATMNVGHVAERH